MKKLQKWMLENWIAGPVGVFGSGVVTAGISWTQRGDWLAYFRDLPAWTYIAAGILLVLFLVFQRRRFLYRINEPKDSSVIICPGNGWQDFATLDAYGVTWTVQIPRRSPLELVASLELGTSLSRNDDTRRVVPIPLCPKCHTELEEQRTFFGAYRWYCLRCGFSVKNNYSYYAVANLVQKLAK